jgi:hypothetical protein
MLSRLYVALILLVVCVQARAVTITLDFTDLISGGQPLGPGTLASLTITDAGANTVDLTLSHSANSAAGQFLVGLWLNVSSISGVVTQSNQNPANKFSGPWQYGPNSRMQLGINFDGHQAFVTSGAGGGVNRVKPGESVSFRLMGLGLDATDFLSTGTPTGQQRTDILALVHIQGINGEPDSGHLAAIVPEPLTGVAVAAGIGALLLRRRKQS